MTPVDFDDFPGRLPIHFDPVPDAIGQKNAIEEVRKHAVQREADDTDQNAGGRKDASDWHLEDQGCKGEQDDEPDGNGCDLLHKSRNRFLRALLHKPDQAIADHDRDAGASQRPAYVARNIAQTIIQQGGIKRPLPCHLKEETQRAQSQKLQG